MKHLVDQRDLNTFLPHDIPSFGVWMILKIPRTLQKRSLTKILD